MREFVVYIRLVTEKEKNEKKKVENYNDDVEKRMNKEKELMEEKEQ